MPTIHRTLIPNNSLFEFIYLSPASLRMWREMKNNQTNSLWIHNRKNIQNKCSRVGEMLGDEKKTSNITFIITTYNNDQHVRNGFVNYVTMNFNLNDKYFFSLFSAHQICRLSNIFSSFFLFFIIIFSCFFWIIGNNSAFI